MFELNKGFKLIALALMLIAFVVGASKLRQIKMDFSTKKLEINFDQVNLKDKHLEKDYE